MEHGAHLVPSDERRLPLGCLSIVAHIIYNGQLTTLAALLSKGAHPCTATLGRTTEEVAIEQGNGFSVLVNYLKHLHIGVIGRYVFALLEGETVDTLGSIEHAVYLHAVNIKIRLHLIVRDVEHLLLHLGRIVEAVVRLQTKVGSLQFLCILLNGLCFGIGLWRIVFNELMQEVVNIGGVLSHRALKRILGIVVISHQLTFLGTQLGQLGNDGEGVILRVGGIGTMYAGLKHLAAQIAVLQTGQDRLLGGIDDNDAILRLAATALGIFLTLRNVGIAQSGKLFFAIHPYHSIIGGLGQEVAPCLLQF